MVLPIKETIDIIISKEKIATTVRKQDSKYYSYYYVFYNRELINVFGLKIWTFFNLLRAEYKISYNKFDIFYKESIKENNVH